MEQKIMPMTTLGTLRSTMADQRLNNLCLLAIEREMSHDLLTDPSSLIHKFALLAERKLSLMN
jgi:hypothetical protein